MEKCIFLIRHAEPILKDKQKRYLGQADPDLSIAGRSQAKQLALSLQGRNIRGVYGSDLKRAVNTAIFIGQIYQTKPILLQELREINMGAWEEKTFQEIREGDPEGFVERGRDIVRFRPPEGESFLDLQARVLPAFNRMIDQADGNIAIVAHAGVNRVILCQLMDIPLKDLFLIPQNYGGISIIMEKEGQFSVLGINRDANCF